MALVGTQYSNQILQLVLKDTHRYTLLSLLLYKAVRLTAHISHQILLADEVIYNFATFCLKASILYLYHRVIFVSRPFTWTLLVVALFVFIYSGIQGVGSFLQCTPLNSNWRPEVKRHCLHIDAAATTFAVCNVLSDFVILILPMPVLWNLKKPTKEKIQIMGMFLMGGL